jgi:hypothetical protein
MTGAAARGAISSDFALWWPPSRRPAMRPFLFAVFLLCLPALALGGQLTVSPSSLSVDNGEQSEEILIAYQPGANVHWMDVQLRLNLDRFGWAQAQVVPSGTPDYATECQVWGGNVRAVASSAASSIALPTAAAIPVCRVRIRTHAHTPRSRNEIAIPHITEHRTDQLFPVYTPATGVRVVVP